MSETSVRIEGVDIIAGDSYTVIYPVNKATFAAQENSKSPATVQTQDYGYDGALGTGDGAQSKATARNLYFKESDIYKFLGVFRSLDSL